MKQLLSGLLIIVISFNAWSDNNSKSFWQADGGELNIHFFYDLLNDFDVEVIDAVKNRQKDWTMNELNLSIRQAGGLDLYVPDDGLKGVPSGQLFLEGQFEWISGTETVLFTNLSLRPVTRKLKAGELTALEIINDAGEVMFYLDHIHAGFNNNKSVVEFNNMDLRISQLLAEKLAKPYLNNTVIGHAHMNSHVSIPTNYEKDLAYVLGGCTSGGWPNSNNEVDVQLIEMSAQYVRSIGNDHVVFTPSATLKNIGTADVAWWQKFSGAAPNYNPPYNNDQHPYLYWSMYREIDNRFEQIGVSGIKHAFFTVNTFCSCSGGHILFPTCEDTYSVGNNDSPSHLGPKDNISAFDGLWQSTGSFFDQIPVGGDGVQDTNSNGTDENRMVVAEADFNDPSLDYYVASWYLIREDIDVFNSMGYRGYDFTANGNAWISSSNSNFINGPASDQYVTPDSFDLLAGTASERIFQAGEGHLTAAVKVIDNQDGSYRYNYMVENHDYDPQIQTISIPLVDSALISDFVFADTDEDSANDWTVSHSNDVLSLQAPAGNEIDWGILYSFSFTSNLPPQAGLVTLTGLENGGNQFNSALITPYYDDLIFADGFEILN